MAENSFTSFFEDWIIKQQSFLQQLEEALLSPPSPTDGDGRFKECAKMIPRVFSHYRKFYQEKAKGITEEVYTFLSPPWLSSFERSLLWISGFRPSFLFRIVERSIAQELSAEQKQRMEMARCETRRKEREITQAMARVQETVAEPPMYSLMRNYGNLVDGEVGEFEEAMEELKKAMVVIVKDADELRWLTAGKVVEILNPVHNVKFLAAFAGFQLQARRWGMENDSHSQRGRAAAASF